MARQTVVHIEGDSFFLNGRPTCEGRTFGGVDVRGLLLNSRMVQGVFDDLNPDTRSRWDYPDGPWDAERNTREFLEAMPLWRAHGLHAFTINMQGGSPRGYSKEQPWINPGYTPEGAPLPDYLARLERVLDRADELGFAVILGMFYFGQDEQLADADAVARATDAMTDWLVEREYRHVLIEIDNECDNRKYEHEILRPDGVVELIDRVKARSTGKLDTPAKRLLTSVSLCGGVLPTPAILGTSDFALLHGNGVSEPARIGQMVDEVRGMDAFAGQPVVFNEDDHYDFAAADNNMLAALRRRAGWGFFDYRRDGEGFAEGYQSVPVSWGITSERKKGFFRLVAEVTGAGG